ncbi:MAG: FAD-dependent oxidoreductase [Planctomycetota bacterium]|jgi:hypothetical protein
MPRHLQIIVAAFILTAFCGAHALGANKLVESESLDNHGGWKLDTQFIFEMGSPYLLAHGLGKPVANAGGQIWFDEAGTYHVHVRTKDWVARWGAPGTPGRFQVAINQKTLDTTFGTEGAEWHWQYGGAVNIPAGAARLDLKDLTGFDGRVDAIYFTTDQNDTPPNDSGVLTDWRREQLGLGDKPTVMDGYDLVVVGGGYAGMGSAISAARMGVKVALIQNRPVLGGNGSSEIRVWAKGYVRRGKFPRVGEIITEFVDHATKSPGTYEEFGDDLKEQVVRAEKNIDLFLNHHAYKVETENEQITAVYAFDTRTSEQKRFEGALFVDCTGHGTLGALAGADWDMTPDGRMGMSNMWAWAEGEEPVSFPETPWALDLEMKDFPYPRDHHGQWFWEGGFDKDPLNDAEGIRDWNLRAVFGAFNAMKNKDGAADHQTAYLTWLAFVGGPRESRRLMGDVVLTGEDVVNKVDFPDGCVPSTWSIDLHYPKEQYLTGKYDDNPFISVAVHDRRIDRRYGYPVPYRCFYSRNIGNLFMAGRNISVTHEALGTTRVMQTCGMMGEVVGKAAAICIERGVSPREVYQAYLPELLEMLTLPGKARRETLGGKTIIPADALEEANPYGPSGRPDPNANRPHLASVAPDTLSGIVVDDVAAVTQGNWSHSTGLSGFVGHGYLYASKNKPATATFNFQVEATGRYEVRYAHQPHENRAGSATLIVQSADGKTAVQVNMQRPPKGEKGFDTIGIFNFSAHQPGSVTFTTEGATGTVHADAIQVVRVKPGL